MINLKISADSKLSVPVSLRGLRPFGRWTKQSRSLSTAQISLFIRTHLINTFSVTPEIFYRGSYSAILRFPLKDCGKDIYEIASSNFGIAPLPSVARHEPLWFMARNDTRELPNMKVLNLFVILFTFFLCSSAFAQSIENMTMTSYYPSPFGAYDRLTLYPRNTPPVACNASNLGMMYYDNSLSPHVFRICINDGTGPHWDAVSVGGFTIWAQTGNNIYPKDTASNPNLKIGIGTILPTNKLQVHTSSSDKDYFAVSADGGSLGLDIRSPEVPGYPYIDFTNSNNVVNYDMRIRLDEDRALDVVGGPLKSGGNPVCTNASQCLAKPHTHPARDITDGQFTGTYTVTGNMSGNINAFADRNSVPFWFDRVDTATPRLCAQGVGSCSTSAQSCSSWVGPFYINWWPTMAKCTVNCSCTDFASHTCEYHCNGDTTTCPGGTQADYTGPCTSGVEDCNPANGGYNCYCDYSAQENYIMELATVGVTRCVDLDQLP